MGATRRGILIIPHGKRVLSGGSQSEKSTMFSPEPVGERSCKVKIENIQTRDVRKVFIDDKEHSPLTALRYFAMNKDLGLWNRVAS